MREPVDPERIALFMRELGKGVRSQVRVYFTGGSTAVLHGWRHSTIDVDICLIPDLDELYRRLPQIKEKLNINIELASPPDFIPPVEGWEDRSIYIGSEGSVHFYHFDPYSQALAKIERGHVQDLMDVDSMLHSGLVDRDKLLALFESIKPQLYRYPAIDPGSFSEAVRIATENTTD
jgi:hypothetical protein